jgi:hypothetical protein
VTTDFRGLWLALAVLTALVIGLIAGGLFYLDSRRVPTAIGNGGIAFVPRSGACSESSPTSCSSR